MQEGRSGRIGAMVKEESRRWRSVVLNSQYRIKSNTGHKERKKEKK